MSPSSSCCLLLSILASSLVDAAPHPVNIWHVQIHEGPAPPPDKGPPLSATASRNKSLLPAQIGAICGAYVLSAFFWLALIFIIGRRLRRKTQTSNRTLSMEMIKPPPGKDMELADLKNIDTPVTVSTVATTNQWPSPTKEQVSPNLTWTSPSGHKKSPSAQESVIDEGVIEEDRAKGQKEMERLYAAVMEHDAKQSKTVYDAKKAGQSPPKSPRTPRSPRSPREYPEFQHLRSQNPMAPTPIDAVGDPSYPSTNSRTSHKFSMPSPMSFFTPAHSRGSSAASDASSRFRRSIRGLPISPPIGSPDLATSFNPHPEEEPLSPRLYNPGPPPVPPTEKTVAFARSPVKVKAPPSNRAPAPSPLSLKSPSMKSPSMKSTNTSKSSLLFRSPTFQKNYPTVPQSAPPTKTTILEKRESQMRQPKTGVPATPYSPYTPFSVTTPMTPSFLVGKAERKKAQKTLRVLNEDEDLVQGDSDMWGM